MITNKKNIFLSIGILFLGLFFIQFVSATKINTELLDIEEKQNTINKDDFKYKSFNSCNNLEEKLESFFKENKDLIPDFYRYRYHPLEKNLLLSSDEMEGFDEAIPVKKEGLNDGKEVDYSKTNIQVEEVDEPDILKTNKKNIFYYNRKTHKIYILDYDKDTDFVNKKDIFNYKIEKGIDISKEPGVKSVITIPERIMDIQLFLKDNKLIFIGSSYEDNVYYSSYNSKRNINNSLINKNERITVIIYDIENVYKPKLDKLFTTLGYDYKARLINDNLYIVANNSFNYRFFFKNWMDTDEEKVKEDFTITKKDIYVPSIEINRNGVGKNLISANNKKTVFSYQILTPNCDDILYMLPERKTLEKTGLQLNLTNIIKLGITDSKIEQKTILGNANNIYLNKKNLYITENLYGRNYGIIPYRSSFINFNNRQNTIIHKFGLGGERISYIDTNVVPGESITQYSMDEDNKGNFRIITKTYNPNLDTHLFVLNKDLNIVGSLLNIKKDEDFKSSRFVEDKLYLVTFKRIDPLFVIDLENSMKPKIIGELKIPGFSTYLHPYKKIENGIQYLIGLGYDTRTTNNNNEERERTVLGGIKIDIYKVDYNKKDSKGNILIEQIGTKTLGDEGSFTNAIDNPRTFVWNNNKKQLTLPLLLKDTKRETVCNKLYTPDGKEIKKEFEKCWDRIKSKVNFLGLKTLQLNEDGKIFEIISKDFQDEILTGEGNKNDISKYSLESFGFRAGYYNNIHYLISNIFLRPIK